MSFLQQKSSTFAAPSQDQILQAEGNLGLFAPDTYQASDFHHQSQGEQFAQNIIDSMPSYLQGLQSQIANVQEQERQRQLAIANQRKEEQLKEIRDNVKYRKAELLRNPDGSLKQDSDLELGVKKGLNWLADKWNKVNDYVPFVDDKTLDINGRMTGTVAGMQNENLDNKNLGLFGGHKDTKAESLKEINSLKDDPNGNGTLYYLRRNIGTEANPEYIYKLGFAALDASDRYRSQVGALGWDIVKEVQSSGAADAEKNAHAAFQGDRLLSYDQVMKDGKWQSRDDASGIHFGSGYGEIYKKDILGWDKKPTQADVEKYKQQVIQNALASGKSGADLSALVKNMSKFGVNDLDNLIKQQNGENSYNKMIEDKVYHKDHYKDDAWTGFKTGVDKAAREVPDMLLDALTPEGLDRTTMLGRMLEADGKGNSQLLDKWKSDEAVNKYHNYDERAIAKANNQLGYDLKNGNYLDAMSDIFMQGNITATANSLGYFAPTLATALVAAPESGGASLGMLGRIGTQIAEKSKALMAEKNALAGLRGTGAAETQAAARVAGLEQDLARITTPLGERFAGIRNGIANSGFYGQAAAMTNERIDERIKNNGGKPTSMLENLGIFAETAVENALDKYVDLGVMHVGEKTWLKDAVEMLGYNEKARLAEKMAKNATKLIGVMGVEGTTEWLQQWGQTFSEQYDTKKNGGTIEGILNSGENREEALQSFIMGAVMGVHVAGAGMAKDAAFGAGTKLWNKASGAEARGLKSQTQQDIADRILDGTYDPYSNVISHTGKTTEDSINDMHMVLDNTHLVSSGIANSALGIGDKNVNDLVANMSNSFKKVYGLQDGSLDGQDQQSVNTYNYLMSNVADKAVSSIIEVADKISQNHKATMSEEDARKLMAELKVDPTTPVQDFIHHYAEAGSEKILIQSLGRLTKAMEQHLDPSTYSSVVLSIGNRFLDNLKRADQSSKLSSDESGTILDKAGKAEADKIFNMDKSGKITLNLAEVHTALSSIKMLEESLSAAAAKAHSNGSIKMGSMSIDSAAKMLSEQAKQLEEIMKRGEKEGNNVKVDPTWFDSLKNSSEVGTEILHKGKSDSADNTHYGKGILEHEHDVLAALHKLNLRDSIKGIDDSKKDKSASAQLMKTVESFFNFAVDRVKPNVAIGENGKIDINHFMTGAERSGKTHSKDYNKYNYFPQEDANGRIAKEKIIEAKFIIQSAKKILTALGTKNSRFTNLSADDRAEIESMMHEIINQSQRDIEYLEAHVSGVENGIKDYKHATNIKYYEKKADGTGFDEKEKAVKGTNIYEHEGNTYKMSNITKTLAKLDAELNDLEKIGAVERHNAIPYKGERLEGAVDIYSNKPELMDHTNEFTVAKDESSEDDYKHLEKINTYIKNNLLGKSIKVLSSYFKFSEKDGKVVLSINNGADIDATAGHFHTAIAAYAQSVIDRRKEYVEREQIARYSNEKFVKLDRANSNVYGFTKWNANAPRSGSGKSKRASEVIEKDDASVEKHPEPQSQDSAETSDNNATSTGEEVNVEDKSEQGSDSRSNETPRESAEVGKSSEGTNSGSEKSSESNQSGESEKLGEANSEPLRNEAGKYSISGNSVIDAAYAELDSITESLTQELEALANDLDLSEAQIADLMQYTSSPKDFTREVKKYITKIANSFGKDDKQAIDLSVTRAEKIAGLSGIVTVAELKAELRVYRDNIYKASSEKPSSIREVKSQSRPNIKDLSTFHDKIQRAVDYLNDESKKDTNARNRVIRSLAKLLGTPTGQLAWSPFGKQKQRSDVENQEAQGYSEIDQTLRNLSADDIKYLEEMYAQEVENADEISAWAFGAEQDSGSSEAEQAEVKAEDDPEEYSEDVDLPEPHDEDTVSKQNKEYNKDAVNLFAEDSASKEEFEALGKSIEENFAKAKAILQAENNAKFLKAYKESQEDSNIRKNFKIVKQGDEEFIQGKTKEGKAALKENFGTISQLMQLCK